MLLKRLGATQSENLPFVDVAHVFLSLAPFIRFYTFSFSLDFIHYELQESEALGLDDDFYASGVFAAQYPACLLLT